MKMPDIKKIVMENGGKPAKLYVIRYIVMGDRMHGEVIRETAYDVSTLLYTLYKIFDRQGVYGMEITPIYTIEQANELENYKLEN